MGSTPPWSSKHSGFRFLGVLVIISRHTVQVPYWWNAYSKSKDIFNAKALRTSFSIMGNNTSSTRKLSASHRHAAPFRKSNQSQNNYQNLEEEFSDLILHEVKRQKERTGNAGSHGDTYTTANTLLNERSSSRGDNFTEDLIEDEFNELNQGIMDSDEVTRNILPDTGSDDDNAMQIDESTAAGSSQSPLEADSITKVDFSKILQPAMDRKPPLSAQNSNCSGSTTTNNSGSQAKPTSELVSVRIKWVNHSHEAITKVAVIGSFSNWRDVIKLKPSQSSQNEYSTTVKLPLGVHKLLYVVNNEYRVSELLPTATDQEGILFNWFEVLDPHHLFNKSMSQSTLANQDANIVQSAGEHNATQIQQKSNSYLVKESLKEKGLEHEHVEYLDQIPPPINMSGQNSHDHSYTSLTEEDEYRQPIMEYSSEIPEMLVDYNYFKRNSLDYELPEPPHLPAHLNNVLLNKMSGQQQQNHSTNIPQIGEDPGFTKRPALRRADSSYYASNKEAYHRSIPNHVILNHLMTTSIRNDVLTVACITRYSGKFVTQIMHSPADVVPDEA